MGNTNLGYTFDATQVAPTSRPPALPTGWYNVLITQGEIKPTRSGDGGFVEFGLKILDGEYAGRMVFDRLNLWNNNPLAVEIAQGAMSAICHATNVFQVQDVSALFGKPLMARVMYRPAKDGYDENNEIKGYAKTGEKQTGNGGGAPAVMAPQTPAGAPDFNPPWGQQPAQAPAPSQMPPAPQTPPAPQQPWQQPATPPATPPGPPAAGATPPWAR